MKTNPQKAPFKGLGYQGRYEDECDGLEPVATRMRDLIANVMLCLCIVLVVGVLAAVRGA